MSEQKTCHSQTNTTSCSNKEIIPTHIIFQQRYTISKQNHITLRTNMYCPIQFITLSYLRYMPWQCNTTLYNTIQCHTLPGIAPTNLYPVTHTDRNATRRSFRNVLGFHEVLRIKRRDTKCNARSHRTTFAYCAFSPSQGWSEVQRTDQIPWWARW